MENGLDGQHGAHQSGGRRNSAASLEVVEVVHGEPVAHPELVLLHPVAHLLNALALSLFHGGQGNQHALAHGSAQGVHDINLPLGELLAQLGGGNHGRLIRSRKAGGEGQNQNILALAGKGGQPLGHVAGVDGRCGGALTGPNQVKKILGGHLTVVRIVVIGFPLDGKG
ncbi:hypothetical protein SDC9_113377 [bioreactor metagenome]|uniref:Uncharacterized protein n=1 Tax=bioreactor metagenome TaxID=1076179 RepID=A0A645BLW4_9ZZZZ